MAAAPSSNIRNEAYYRGKVKPVAVDSSMPKELLDLGVVSGWGGKCVDVLANRSVLEGFDGEDAATLESIVPISSLIELYEQAVTSELTDSCAFLTVSKGMEGEPRRHRVGALGAGCRRNLGRAQEAHQGGHLRRGHRRRQRRAARPHVGEHVHGQVHLLMPQGRRDVEDGQVREQARAPAHGAVALPSVAHAPVRQVAHQQDRPQPHRPRALRRVAHGDHGYLLHVADALLARCGQEDRRGHGQAQGRDVRGQHVAGHAEQER